MTRKLAICIGLGILGVLIGSAIVYGAVSAWTELSSSWVEAGFVVPLMTLIIGLAVVTPAGSPERKTLRRALLPVAALVGTAGNYLAFVITSHVWYADRIPAAQQSWLFQLLHPSVLPSFVSRSSPSSSGIEQTWIEHVVIGFVAALVAFWWITSRMNPKPASATKAKAA